jgi:large subunit ribosomal protein L14
MVIRESNLSVYDNSGALMVQCIRAKNPSTIGDTITVTVKKAKKNQNLKGTVHQAVVFNTKKKYKRPDGSLLRFCENSCVLINNKKLPVASRITGFATYEMRKRKWLKILALSRFIL